MKYTLILAGLISLGLAGPIPSDAAEQIDARQTEALNADTDRLLFSTSMPDFIAARNAQNPKGLDWSSDGCSSSPDDPFGFKFLDSCYRHDFGYRNYKAQNRFTSENKLRIDNNFRADLYNLCDIEGAGRGACRVTADVYYQAVRWFGGKRPVLKEDGQSLVMEVDGAEVQRLNVSK